MAGSLNHITRDDGTFTMDLIENLGDAHEALEECHQIIAALLASRDDPMATLALICQQINAAVPEAVPVRQAR